MVESIELRFPYAEDFRPAVRADTRDRRLPVLERDGQRVLNLHVHLALDTICLWHVRFI